jgi:hypothetical protein
MKKEASFKKEVKEEMLAPEEDERPWWVKELVMAGVAHHPMIPLMSRASTYCRQGP